MIVTKMQRGLRQVEMPAFPTSWYVAGVVGSVVTLGALTTAIILIIRAAKRKGH
jgi:hypothetical protein